MRAAWENRYALVIRLRSRPAQPRSHRGARRFGQAPRAIAVFVAAALISLAALGCSGSRSMSGSSEGSLSRWRTTCTAGALMKTGNSAYEVDNSDGPGGRTCLAVNPAATQFRLGSSAYDAAKVGPADESLLDFTGYMSIFTGCQLGVCLEPRYPIEVLDIRRELTSWSFTFSANGRFDAIYDMFFNTTRAQRNIPNGGEVEIMLNHQDVSLAGPELPDVTIEGARWHVYSARKTIQYGSWNRIAFERVTPVDKVTDLDLAPFVRAAIGDRALSPEWYQQDLRAGFEVYSGGVGLATNSFAAGDPNAG